MIDISVKQTKPFRQLKLNNITKDWFFLGDLKKIHIAFYCMLLTYKKETKAKENMGVINFWFVRNKGQMQWKDP